MIHRWSNDLKRNKCGKKVESNFIYSSETNTSWITDIDLLKWFKADCSENFQ